MNPGREPTDFEMRVFRATKRIPRGKVTTYGLIAGAIGCGSSRAVGQALSRNPFAPRVPCHRVIRGDLSTGGFSGKREGPTIARKLRLLKEEGVVFEGGKLREPARLFRF